MRATSSRGLLRILDLTFVIEPRACERIVIVENLGLLHTKFIQIEQS
jgi:hypothetical protein